MSTDVDLVATEDSPEPERPSNAVYRMYDENDVLLYVGMTVNVEKRIYQHFGTKDWWSDVAIIEVQHHYSRQSAAEAERIAIARERPMYNLMSPALFESEPLSENVLDDLLGDRQTGDRKTDLIAGMVEFVRRQREIMLSGAAIVKVMKSEMGMTYREIEEKTGVPRATAQRWVRLSLMHGEDEGETA